MQFGNNITIIIYIAISATILPTIIIKPFFMFVYNTLMSFDCVGHTCMHVLA